MAGLKFDGNMMISGNSLPILAFMYAVLFRICGMIKNRKLYLKFSENTIDIFFCGNYI